MKRKMLMRMLAAALSASLLAGCGNTAKPADSGSVVTAGEEEGQMRLRRRMWKKNPVQKNQRKLM